MYLANEGRFIAFVDADHAEHAIEIIDSRIGGTEACVIGRVEETRSGNVTMTSLIGALRIVDMFSGEQLPRIC
jgi:hydrogenase expression/formation protein HypE